MTQVQATSKPMTMTDRLLAAFKQAEKEIGFIDVKGNGHPPRVVLGADYGYGPTTVSALYRELRNGQCVRYGSGANGYRYVWPEVLVKRAREIYYAELDARIAARTAPKH